MTVFRPKDEQELAGVIQQALEREEPLELLGGGSKRGLGRPPQTPHRLELGAFPASASTSPKSSC